MAMSKWLPERRRRIRRLAGSEVPASLVTVRGDDDTILATYTKGIIMCRERENQ